MSDEMWNDEREIADLPRWIEGMTYSDAIAVYQGGCASGAWMPAVTYWQARETMNEHGDDVLDYIEEHLSEVPPVPVDTSWSGIAVFFLSYAVEIFASGVVDQWEPPDDEEDEEDDEDYDDE